MVHRSVVAISAIAVLLTASFARAQYTAIDLTPPGAVSAGFEGVGTGYVDGNATLWTLSAAGYSSTATTNLNPAGFYKSNALVGIGGKQGGSASVWLNQSQTQSADHAALWTGSAVSFVDLNPAGFAGSAVNGMYGNVQVGAGLAAGPNLVAHPLVWTGTASSAVDLLPAGYYTGSALAVYGNLVGGTAATPAELPEGHAILWNLGNNTFVDLHPGGFLGSVVSGISANDQVGWALQGAIGTDHAYLWHGTAASGIDLTPSNYYDTFATATNGLQEVGYGNPVGSNDPHAIVWSGNANQFVDLQNLLPTGYKYSMAFGIDDQGDIFGEALDSNGVHAIEWHPIPEPALLPAFAAAIGLFHRRRKTLY